MTENEAINGWTFEETIQTTENLMEVENNVFKWDVLRHLRDFAESFKDELEQYRAIGTIDEFKALKEDKKFLEFLYNHILPNEMEQYLSMYHTKDKVAVNGYADQCGLMPAT